MSGRHLEVEISPKRGTHRVVLAEPVAVSEGRRYVLVSKAEPPNLENFHWIFEVPPGHPAAVVLIETQYWVYSSPRAFLFIGQVADDRPLALPEGAPEFMAVRFEPGEQLDDSVHFVPEVEELPFACRKAYEEFYEAYEAIDGYQLSFECKGHQGAALTYGESHFVPILRLLQALQVGPEDIIVDLGSGTGRVVLAAALGFPFLRGCCGIELLPALHGAALRASSCVKAPTAPLKLVEGDLLEEDWSDATVVFAMSLCFPEEMMQALELKFRLLKPKSVVILMHCFMDESCLEPATPSVVRLEMSFGETPLYIFRRRLALDEMD